MSVKHIGAVLDLPRDDRLISTDVLVLVVFANCADSKTGACFPSLEHVAEQASISKATAKRSVARLCEVGLLEKTPRIMEGRGQTSNDYVVLPGGQYELGAGSIRSRAPGPARRAPIQGRPDDPAENRQLDPSERKEERTTLSRAEMAERFKQLWESSPKRIGANRLAAWQSFRARLFEVSDVVAEADMIAIGVQAWAEHVKATGDDLQFAPGLAAFINLKRYRDDWTGATDWLGQEDKGHG